MVLYFGLKIIDDLNDEPSCNMFGVSSSMVGADEYISCVSLESIIFYI